MKITLEAWAAQEFRPAPKIRTLRAWAKSGQIIPSPVKVGKAFMVEETAQYQPLEVSSDGLSERARKILHGAKAA